MRTILLGAAITLLTATTAFGDGPEHLVLKPYPASPPWLKITDQSTKSASMWEFAPPGESQSDDYPEIVAAFAYYGVQAKIDPAGFLRRIFAGAAKGCERFSANDPVVGSEGGFQVAYATIYCSRQNGKPYGVIMSFKVIQGDTALYSIDRDHRTSATTAPGVFQAGEQADVDKTAAITNRYLSDGVYICGGRSTDLRC